MTEIETGVLTGYANDRDENQTAYWTDLASTNGDSGAPVYTVIDRDRYLFGVHAWSYDTPAGENRAGGNRCEKIND
ncbi:trypsin-like serine peptidase [Halorussus litoreus]|uniref:hypothetical protein n=1 Tax=Halorussus litoreus TaxID=1710536 RepID=UPI001300A48F|nr:hypothetical protein [Halorussus litoreus]